MFSFGPVCSGTVHLCPPSSQQFVLFVIPCHTTQRASLLSAVPFGRDMSCHASCTETHSVGIFVLGLANKITFTFIESRSSVDTSTCVHTYKLVKKIPLEARTGPEGSRRLKLPDFKTLGT